MYKYYNDLENYNVVLKKMSFTQKIYPKVPTNIYIKYSNLFKELKFINNLIISFDCNLFMKHLHCNRNINNFDLYLSIGELDSFINDFENNIQKSGLNINNNNLEDLILYIKAYDTYIKYFQDIYPNFKDRLLNIQKNLKKLLQELQNTIIKIEHNKYKTYKFPNAFFITPNGYLYNSGGAMGHKGNNFIDDYQNIESALINNLKINIDTNYLCQEKNTIIKRGYVNDYELGIGVLNLYYNLPTIYTKEIEYARNINQILIKNNEDEILRKIKRIDEERSYQTKLLNLIIGYYDASINFFQFFNNSFDDNPREKYIQLKEILGNMDLYDEIVELLVRCMNFSKIESQIDKTITTTSLYPVQDFYNYLINGYNIDVIPKIINDNNEFKEQDVLNNFPISSYKALEKYELEQRDKGKVRIRNK